LFSGERKNCPDLHSVLQRSQAEFRPWRLAVQELNLQGERVCTCWRCWSMRRLRCQEVLLMVPGL
jgi:hypothetical protein